MNRSFMDKAANPNIRRGENSAKNDPKEAAVFSLDKKVFRLHNTIEKYSRLAEQVGTSKDTVTLRANISLRKEEVQKQTKEIKSQFAEITKRKDELDFEKQENLKKIATRFAQHLDQFQKVLKICSDREVASPPINLTKIDYDTTEPAETEALLQQQEQEARHLDDMISYNAAIIDERDSEIQGLVRDIGELNEMFQDVAVMVVGQGEQLTVINENANLVDSRVSQGKNEIERAEQSQIAASRKKNCLAVVAGAVVGTIIAILILM